MAKLLPPHAPQPGDAPQHSLLAQSCDVVGQENLLQGCSFSPDGLCVLTSTASDGKLRLYNTVVHNHNNPAVDESSSSSSSLRAQQPPPQSTPRPWKSALEITAGDVVRSYAWYPQMSSQNPASCCFAATSREQPVHLYDAYTGGIRATYRPYNGLDEMDSPTVIEFSRDCQKLLCGGFLRSDRVLHIFDLAVPGRDSTVIRMGKTRRSSDGQKGIVSAIATSPDGRFFGVGTYAPGSIYLYDDRVGHFSNHTVLNGLCVVGHGRSHSRRKRRFVETISTATTTQTAAATAADDASGVGGGSGDGFIRQAKTKWFQTRAQGGVTQLMFAPNDEYFLYSASRRSDSILKWDLRMLSRNVQNGEESSSPNPIMGIGSFRTCSDTNQRLEFDLNDDGSTMYVGGTDRCVRIYDTQTAALLGTIDGLDDASNGVSFARLSNQKSYLAVATGSRRFAEIKDDEEEEEKEQDQDKQQDLDENKPLEVPGYLRLYQLDTSKEEREEEMEKVD